MAPTNYCCSFVIYPLAGSVYRTGYAAMLASGSYPALLRSVGVVLLRAVDDSLPSKFIDSDTGSTIAELVYQSSLLLS